MVRKLAALLMLAPLLAACGAVAPNVSGQVLMKVLNSEQRVNRDLRYKNGVQGGLAPKLAFVKENIAPGSGYSPQDLYMESAQPVYQLTADLSQLAQRLHRLPSHVYLSNRRNGAELYAFAAKQWATQTAPKAKTLIEKALPSVDYGCRLQKRLSWAAVKPCGWTKELNQDLTLVETLRFPSLN